MVPWVPYAILCGVLLIVAAVMLKQIWLQVLVAVIFLASSAAYSIRVLPVGVMLAGVGLMLVIAGVIWRFTDRRSYGGLLWPGLGLLVAPIANIFVVMPIMRFS